MGHRVLELLAFRDKQYKRETKLIGILQVRACVRGVCTGDGGLGPLSMGPMCDPALQSIHCSDHNIHHIYTYHTVRLLDGVEGALQQGGRLAGAEHGERGRVYVRHMYIYGYDTYPRCFFLCLRSHHHSPNVHYADMIHEREPITNTYVSAPGKHTHLSRRPPPTTHASTSRTRPYTYPHTNSRHGPAQLRGLRGGDHLRRPQRRLLRTWWLWCVVVVVVVEKAMQCACLCVCLCFFPATTLINQTLTSTHTHPYTHNSRRASRRTTWRSGTVSGTRRCS